MLHFDWNKIRALSLFNHKTEQKSNDDQYVIDGPIKIQRENMQWKLSAGKHANAT